MTIHACALVRVTVIGCHVTSAFKIVGWFTDRDNINAKTFIIDGKGIWKITVKRIHNWWTHQIIFQKGFLSLYTQLHYTGLYPFPLFYLYKTAKNNVCGYDAANSMGTEIYLLIRAFYWSPFEHISKSSLVCEDN